MGLKYRNRSALAKLSMRFFLFCRVLNQSIGFFQFKIYVLHCVILLYGKLVWNFIILQSSFEYKNGSNTKCTNYFVPRKICSIFSHHVINVYLLHGETNLCHGMKSFLKCKIFIIFPAFHDLSRFLIKLKQKFLEISRFLFSFFFLNSISKKRRFLNFFKWKSAFFYF